MAFHSRCGTSLKVIGSRSHQPTFVARMRGAQVRTMLRPVARVLVLLFIAGLQGCSDERKRAVDEVIAFVEEAPFGIAAPKDSWSGYSVVVTDSALPRFNKLFRYFRSDPTDRTENYQALPGQLLWALPVTRTVGVVSRRLGGDTLLVSVVFERPDPKLFSEALVRLLGIGGDSFPPSQEKREAFRSALLRAKQELPTVDTAYFRVTPQPHIVYFRTGSGIRDSILRDSLSLVAGIHLKKVAEQATFELSKFTYFRFGAPPLGGSAQGTVRPGEAGWYVTPGVYVSLQVQCRASRGAEHVDQIAYILPKTESPHKREDFLCMWLGDEAEQWDRIGPTHLSVRFVSIVRGDTISGPWHELR